MRFKTLLWIVACVLVSLMANDLYRWSKKMLLKEPTRIEQYEAHQSQLNEYHAKRGQR